ncbi:hypothetical protein D3C87_1925930 [compost metagenome]
MGMAKVLQEIVVDPSQARVQEVALSKTMSCMVAVGLNKGMNIEKAASLGAEVRDLVISNESRQERYITYNLKLNGKVLSHMHADLENCRTEK